MSTDAQTVERELDNVVDTEMDPSVAPDTISDRMADRLQMQEIQRRTIAPGVMKLEVDDVSTAENSAQWAIDLKHPGNDDTIRLFVEKPMDGWSRDYKLVRMFDWYGIDSGDPHQFNFMDLVVAKRPDESDRSHGWVFVEPPDYDPPIRTQLSRKAGAVRERLSVDTEMNEQTAVWLTLLGTVGAIPMALSAAPVSGALLSSVLSMVLFTAATIAVLAVVNP